MKCQVDAKDKRRENISAKSEIERTGFERVLCLDIFRIWRKTLFERNVRPKKTFYKFHLFPL